MQAVATRFTSNGNSVEEGTFQKQILCTCAYATVFAAHDTGHSQRTFVVSDYQGISAQGDFLAIEQHQLLALFGQSHANAALDLGEIEGMQRLTQLKHDIVGDIHHGVDTANIAATQTLDHPQRSRSGQVDIADHATQVAWAGLRRQQLDRAHVIVRCGDSVNLHACHCSAIVSTHFPGQAGNRQAVTTVWRQIDLNDRIVQPEVFTHILTSRRV